jgi:hypothetical protein
MFHNSLPKVRIETNPDGDDYFYFWADCSRSPFRRLNQDPTWQTCGRDLLALHGAPQGGSGGPPPLAGYTGCRLGNVRHRTLFLSACVRPSA